jgi:hypothetical protein
METGTHFEWSWDEWGGDRFRRYRRELPIEAWLIGIEMADDLRNQFGRNYIMDGLVRRSATVTLGFWFMPLVLNVHRGEIDSLMDAAQAYFPQMPPAAILEALWRFTEARPPEEPRAHA